MFLPASVSKSHHYQDLVCEDEENEDQTNESVDAGEEENVPEDTKEEDEEAQEALFDPPLYKQRYSAVADIINKSDSKFVIDMGCSEGQFISKVKDMCPCVEKVIGVDVDLQLLHANSNRLKPLTIEYILKRETPLTLSLYNGSISEPDLRFRGVDLIACIEVIEHLYQDTLDKVPNALFGVLEPKVVVVTTPNCEYNVLFKNFSGMRHHDHKFEWTRHEFDSWCADIVKDYPYDLHLSGVGDPPVGSNVGYCSQMAIFTRRTKDNCVLNVNKNFDNLSLADESLDTSNIHIDALSEIHIKNSIISTTSKSTSKYNLVIDVVYPYDELSKNLPQKILNETEYIINHFFSDISDESEETFVREIPVAELLLYPGIKKFNFPKEQFLTVIESKYSLSADYNNLLVTFHLKDFLRDSWFSDDDDDFDLDGEFSLNIHHEHVSVDDFGEDWD